jgi:bifunctional UDP-N-acetylglucosamine pyrophosphorylase / glucosamine-1-phosphate N-acetyltransferase
LINIVIMAAGQGKRMRSDLPKVLHPIAGRSLLARVLATARSLNPKKLVVIYGHGGDQVKAALDAPDLAWAIQSPQLGTGHAVMQGVPFLDDAVPTMVLNGDVPLTRASTLKALLAAAGNDKLALLTVALDNPSGYGRIVRSPKGIEKIVEHKDASAEQLKIKEIYSGILVAPTAKLKTWLAALSNTNEQNEYYLTDIVAQAVAANVPVVAAHPTDSWETDGVNSKVQLAQLERAYQQNLAKELMEAGVMLADPARLDIRGDLQCGKDVAIDVNVVFEGSVTLADGVSIGANCVIKNASIGAGTRIEPFCHLEEATVGAQARIGPYARLRPGTQMGDNTHVGNFVEMKNTHFGDGSKANHLAYVGDARIGANVNIGAGTITCNYDGVNKAMTTIDDDAFIGSDSQLVAPVHVGKGATLGAGTTLTKDAPAGKLTISRSKQQTIDSWKRPAKINKEKA